MGDDLRERLTLPRFPRTAAYDPQWMIQNVMGPNPLWLLEWLWPSLGIEAGARVLDLGCGKALTSIFMAREYGVRVTAADLWIKPGENWGRVCDAGCEEVVTPISAEAHDLPFAEGYFDAVVSVDAYHYFGSDGLYLPYLSRFVRPGGVIGIVVPGVETELDEVPEHLAPYWEPGFWTFHSAQWWQRHWSRSGVVDVETADVLPDGWRDWALWNEVCAEEGDTEWVRQLGGREAEMVRLDAGRTLAFVRVVGRTAAA
jgi:cyclopropane fatty-acyl-phospholipid synthase-like methyltransferase